MGSLQEESLKALPQNVFALIVGGGPIGLVTALSLARYGYNSLVLERHAKRLSQPKAHVLNPRTLEIFRQMELDVTPLKAQGLPQDEAETIRFVSSMSGTEYGTIDWKQDPDNWGSPESMFNVPQPILEEHLSQIALATGKVIHLRMFEWKECIENEDKTITSTILCHKTNTFHATRSKYLIACDGAGATSREILGIGFQPVDGGPERTLHYASVHFSADLSSKGTGLLWFILDPKQMGVFIAYNRKNSWVYFIGYDPNTTSKESLNSEYFKTCVFKAVGHPVEDYRELGITIWTTSPKLANVYRSPKFMKAFLAGDAAHSFPPTGGLGVNTGIGDVQNLVWKIHAVEQSWASGALLDTITQERWPVARANGLQSKLNEDKIFRLAEQIQDIGSCPAEAMSDPNIQGQIQALIADNRDHFHCLDLHLGYAYGQKIDRDVDDYRKELISGARLPHAWLFEQGGDISSLDLVDGSNFVLFTPRNFTSSKAVKIGGAPMSIKQLGRDFTDGQVEWTELVNRFGQVAVLVRPDQHIVDTFSTLDEAKEGLLRYLRPPI